MAKATPRWLQDGLRWPQDGPKMAQHRLPGPFWGHLGASSGPTWRHLGPCRGHRALHKQTYQFSNGLLHDFKVNPEPSWGHVGAILAHLGAILGHLGAISGHLGASWVPTPIGKTCCHSVSGPKKGPLGAILGHLGASSGPTWRHLGPCRGHSALHKQRYQCSSGF